MIALVEVLLAIPASILAVLLWRRQPRDMLRVVIWCSRMALAWVAVSAVTGIPLFFYRFRDAALPNARVVSLMHHYLGHLFVAAFLLFSPLLFVASVGRPRTPARKFLLGAAAFLTLVLFLFVAFTGYLLPKGMPRELAPWERMAALRFVVLHMIAAPLLATTGLGLLLWRHSRQSDL